MDLESITRTLDMRQKNNLDGMPVHCKPTFTHIFTLSITLRVHQPSWFLGSRRKLDNPEGTRTDTRRTGELGEHGFGLDYQFYIMIADGINRDQNIIARIPCTF